MPADDSESGAALPGRSKPWTALLWASLLPALLLLRPYAGIVQDARIYIGRGLADRDPAGLGSDLMFAGETQTAFSLFRAALHPLLSLAGPDAVSMALVAVGLLAWLAGAVLLMRHLADGRAAWAAVMAALALPGDYGPLHIFGYAEPIATPRLFAEAAVLAGLGQILAGRRPTGLALLCLAAAIHPLMALPGLALAAILLVRADPRWLVPWAVLGAAGFGAAALGAPVFGRLFVAMDPAWLAIVRARNANLFPSLWPIDTYGTIACQVAAVVIAGHIAGARSAPAAGGEARRAVFWWGGAVGLGGLVLSWLAGDIGASVLVLQLQTWRALWLLAMLANAGLVLAWIGLWRGGAAARLTLALLTLAWASPSSTLVAPLAVAATACHLTGAAGWLRGLTPLTGRVATAAALAAAGAAAVAGGQGLFAVLRPLGAGWRDQAPWPYVVASGLLTAPVLAGAVALALAPASRLRTPRARALALLCAVAACGTAASLWDSRNPERRMVDARAGAAALEAGLGPGGLLWVDDDSETWFLARRPAVFSPVQGAPILFSRDLALAWAARAGRLSALGLVRPGDLAVAPRDSARDVPVTLTPAGLRAFCRDAARPAGLVVPGDQRAAVPEDMSARLWIPPTPIRRLSIGEEGATWRSIVDFTVVSCSPPAPSRDGGRGEMQSFG